MEDFELDMIYFDMDGVLADFYRGVREMCGMDVPDQNRMDRETNDLMFARIRDTPDFFLRLKPIEGTVELFHTMRGLYGDRVEILTGIPKPSRNVPRAAEEKVGWVRKNIDGDVVVHTVLRSEKADFVRGRGSVLIDDLERNIDAWNEAGGTGILFTDSDSALARLKDLGLLRERFLPGAYLPREGPALKTPTCASSRRPAAARS